MVITRRSRKGMTLIEILVAMALFALFTLTLTQLLMGGMRTYRRGQAISSLRNDLKFAMETVANDVRVAGKIGNLVRGTKSLMFNLETRRQDLSNPIATESNVTEISYTLVPDEGVLIRKEGDVVTLVARDLIIDTIPGNSESYFELVSDGIDENVPDYQINIRLSARRYVGTDEQRLSMVTTACASSALFQDSYVRKPVDLVPIVKVGDIARPLLRRIER